MQEYLSQRCKMGYTVFTYRVDEVFIFTGASGTILHATTEDILSDPVAREAHFLTAWQNLSGFIPFTVLRKCRNKYRPAGQTFIPAKSRLLCVKVYGRGRVSAKYTMDSVA